MQIAFFIHTVQNKANSIQFAHQAPCSLHISTLLKAIRYGYLKGCPSLAAHGVSKYLNPSPATAKAICRKQREQDPEAMLQAPTSTPSTDVMAFKPQAPTHEEIDLINQTMVPC